MRPIEHIFTASKAPWHDVTDEIMQLRDFISDQWVRPMQRPTSHDELSKKESPRSMANDRDHSQLKRHSV